MSISFLTAMVIATNEIEIVTHQHKDNEKWMGEICHSQKHLHHPYMPILSTDFIFDTKENAKETMNAIKEDCINFIDDKTKSVQKENKNEDEKEKE